MNPGMFKENLLFIGKVIQECCLDSEMKAFRLNAVQNENDNCSLPVPF